MHYPPPPRKVIGKYKGRGGGGGELEVVHRLGVE